MTALAPAIESGETDVVVIHDAARPLAAAQVFLDVIDAATLHGGALPVRDQPALTTLDESAEPAGRRTVAVQTPQAFRASVLRAAHQSGSEATDDAALVELCGGRVVVVAGEVSNRKITHLEDLAWARELAEKEGR